MGKVGADDAHLEWVKVHRKQREAGGWVYIDAWTLGNALEDAGLPRDTKPDDLEARRYTLKSRNGVAEVLIKLRVKGTTVGGGA